MRNRHIFSALVAVLLALAAPFGGLPSPGPMSQDRAQPASEPAQNAAAVKADPVFDEAASFLAGRPCRTSPYKEFQAAADYKAYVSWLDKNWTDMENKRLKPMRDWSATEMSGVHGATKTLFYPFGGPDALTAAVFFPDATRYVLLGLEFVGHVPDFSGAGAQNWPAYIANLQTALGDFFKKSYFITKNMSEELADDKVDGVLPLLCFFLKRSGYVIASVERLAVSETGELTESPYPGEKTKLRRPFGIRVSYFTEGSGILKDVSYVSCDLANGAFRPGKPLYAALQGLPFETTFLKSASYLMHYREFSNIRGLILEQSRFILQDDTGIPFREFSADKWDVRLYGEYINPVADFTGVGQPDLKDAYLDTARVKSLPFHLGYHWGTNKDSLLFVVKK